MFVSKTARNKTNKITIAHKMKHTTIFRSILPLCIAGTALFFAACEDNEETEEIGSLSSRAKT